MERTPSFTQFFTRLALVAAALAAGAAALPGGAAAQSSCTRTVTNTGDGGAGSLRQAITDSNADPNHDVICFQIPQTDPGYNAAAGVWTIAPASALPAVNTPMTIDGYTQPGASKNTLDEGTNAVLKIELSGAAIPADQFPTGLAVGIPFAVHNCEITGLVINRFYVGINVNRGAFGPSSGHVIRGNFIGTDPTGTADLGNRSDGISLASVNSAIGGTAPADRNLISGNDGAGVFLGGTGVGGPGNLVRGNLVGTNAAGTAAVPNSTGVVLSNGDSFTVGGADADDGAADGVVRARNVISGNAGVGVQIGPATGSDCCVHTSRVQGNFIGTQADGASPLGNGDGIAVGIVGDTNQIGGASLDAGNRIAHNRRFGVSVSNGVRLPVVSNLFFSNASLGIDRSADGLSPNDPGDASGPQNFPVLTSASISGGTTNVQGTLSSVPSTSFRLEFFANVAADPTCHGEGESFLGSARVTTDAAGAAGFSFTLPFVTPGQVITATATRLTAADALLDTSEFSAVEVAGPPPAFQFSSSTFEVSESAGAATITVTRADAPGGVFTVRYATSDGTGAAGSDYTAASGTLTFGVGETTKTFSVAVASDSVVEGDETVSLTLSEPGCEATLGSPAAATLTIREAAQTASISGRVLLASGAPVGGVTVTLGGDSSATATTDAAGNYSFAALAPGDYTLTPSRPRFSFSPPSRAVTLGAADVTGADFTAAPAAAGPAPAGGPLLISEFRLSGETSDDEYVELYNNAEAPLDISGYQLDSLAGLTVTVPEGTVLAPRGHYLIARPPAPGSGYSLSASAAADQTYADFDLPAATGLALFDRSGALLDAAGAVAGAGPYGEGAALPAVHSPGQHAFVRRLRSGRPQDTSDNASDFALVSPDAAAYDGAQSALGAPGPQNTASPTQLNDRVKASLLAPCVSHSQPPNQAREQCPEPGACGANRRFGTFSIRRRFTNMTGAAVTRLRFRVVNVTAGPPPDAATADLRALTSAQVTVTGEQDPCGAGFTVEGLTLEDAPAQPLGGALNSTLAAGTVALDSPLGPGQSKSFEFLLGVEQRGAYSFFVNVEALTAAEPAGAAPRGARARPARKQ
jgi:hypothetical protein